MSQKCFSKNFKMFSLFTKYLFSNLCFENGLFETNNVKTYMNRRLSNEFPSGVLANAEVSQVAFRKA